ncbi:hypothetical protein ACNIU2_26610, partial [Escherichia coli]
RINKINPKNSSSSAVDFVIKSVKIKDLGIGLMLYIKTKTNPEYILGLKGHEFKFANNPPPVDGQANTQQVKFHGNQIPVSKRHVV